MSETATTTEAKKGRPDVERQVGEILRAAGRCPRPGQPVPEPYLAALLALRELAGADWWEPTRKNCNSGPAEEWYDLMAGGATVAAFWGRKDGRHVAAAFLAAAVVNVLPALAGEVLRLRQQAADDEVIDNLPHPGEVWGAAARPTP